MRAEVVDFEELSDSREMLEAREPNFIIIFIYIILVIITTAFIWMWFGEIDVTVRANGVLRPAKSVSVIRNINGGKIEELYYYENKPVTEGELLYVLDSTNLELQLEKLLTEKRRLVGELEKLKKLEESIKKDENLFTEEEIEYYNRYLVYKYEKEGLLLDYNQAKNRYTKEKQLSPSFTTKSQLEELETDYRMAEANYERFISEYRVSVKKEIESNERSLLEAESGIEELENKIKLNSVRAPINGSLQVYYEFNPGDYMPAGLEVMRVIPDKGRDYRVEMVVQNKDISHLETGQKVRYRFQALPYKEYGTLEGEIIRVSRDAITGENETGMVYRVEASISETELYDKNGNPARIKPGMVCESRIVIRQKKILYFVLEKLDFIS